MRGARCLAGIKEECAMQHVVRVAVAAWFATGLVPASAAAPPDEIGVLTCTVGPIVNASASGTSVGNEAREMLCTFKTGQGPEETYAALLRSIGGKTPEGQALIWSVRAPLGTRYSPGLLQQAYMADRATPLGQVPPLIGERNDTISLYTLTEKPPGAVSKEEQPSPTLIVADMELVLKAAVG
jgi:hypothetical protein